ncbi:MAG: hypothetical protein Kow0090_09380 [Myxococcota bacterium]
MMDAHDIRQLEDYITGVKITRKQVEELLKWAKKFYTEATNWLK